MQVRYVAIEKISPCATRQRIRAAHAAQGVIPRAAIEKVVAVIANRMLRAIADQIVITFAAEEQIIASAALERVIAGATVQQIIAKKMRGIAFDAVQYAVITLQNVVARAAIQSVAATVTAE